MDRYSEKELNILGGVLKLARSGCKLRDVTVKQIADAAKVGKATVYDYFSSKEEIIVKALIHTLCRQNTDLRQRLEKTEGYKEKLMLVFCEIIDTVENSFSIFNLVISLGGPGKVREYFKLTDSCGMLGEAMSEVADTFSSIVAFGIASGDIKATDRDYIQMVFTSVIFSVGRERKQKRLPKDKICSNAYEMMSKALA